jgi:hypothetical protein
MFEPLSEVLSSSWRDHCRHRPVLYNPVMWAKNEGRLMKLFAYASIVRVAGARGNHIKN